MNLRYKSAWIHYRVGGHETKCRFPALESLVLHFRNGGFHHTGIDGFHDRTGGVKPSGILISPFKFNADMATAWRKVKTENDLNFTIQDMLKVYYGESDYAKYDNSACQWNQFLKDFCSDEFSDYYSNKLKVAAIIWKEVRDSKNEKVYSRELLKKYEDKI